jgi:hypothetical protein
MSVIDVQVTGAIISTIACPKCRYYCWQLAAMKPAFVRGRAHHPSCPCVIGPRRLPHGFVVRARRPS